MRLPILIAVCLCICPAMKAQRTYSPNLSVGGRGGVTLSSMSFTPSVDQGMATGFTVGAVVRYTEEKCVGVIGEINIAQRGWAESYDPGEPWQYRRTLTYIDIPVMTHIFFGPQRFKCFVNLGPEIAFMIGSGIKSNFDWQNPSAVRDYPKNRQTEQLYEPVKNKIDYGITAGIGCEWKINRRNSVLVEARYYFGLGNIYPAGKADTFSASRATSIEVTAGYLFRLK